MTTPQTPVDALAAQAKECAESLRLISQTRRVQEACDVLEQCARALAAIPAPTDPEDCNAWCPRCNGSGDDVEMSDSSPDAHEVLVNCRHCDGSGTLYGAYTGVVRELEKREKAYLKACGDLYFAKNAPTPPTAPAQDAQGERNAQMLIDIGNAALRAGWNGVDLQAFVIGRLASPSPSAVQPLSEAHGDVRVACITLDGSTLYIPAKEITDFGIGDDDGETYTLTFKTMTRAEFEALGEFDGF